MLLFMPSEEHRASISRKEVRRLRGVEQSEPVDDIPQEDARSSGLRPVAASGPRPFPPSNCCSSVFLNIRNTG